MLFEVSRNLARTPDPTSTDLQKGIERCAQELQSDTRQSSRPRTPRLNLTGRSALASQANHRTDVFEAEFLRPLSPGFVRPSSARAEGAGDGMPSQVKLARARYKELVSDIEAVMNGGVAPAVAPLHIGEAVAERLAAHGRRHFVLTLPTQPATVTLQLSCVDGTPPPDLYASTATERPTARNCEHKSTKAGELIYHHDFDMDVADTAAGTLHITVEGLEACEFKLRSAARRVPRRLEPTEKVAMLATKSHANVHKKLETLRKDPQARKKHDQRVASLNRQRRARDKDFDAMNQEKVQEYTPERREAIALTNAGLQQERLQLALQRREVIHKELETRMITLANRDEDRKVLRAAAARKQEDEACLMRWFEKLVVISYGVQLFNRTVAAKILRIQEMRQQRASRTIQFFCMSVLTKRRREALYRNAIKFRCSVMAYARTVKPAMACVAKPKAQWFLSVHSLNRPDMSIVSMIKRFLGWVRLLQRSYRRIRMIRSARVESLLPHFLASELLRPVAAAVSTAEDGSPGQPRPTSANATAAPSAKGRGSVLHHNITRGSPSPKSRGTITPRATRVTNSPRKSLGAVQPRNAQVGRVYRSQGGARTGSEPDHPAFLEYVRLGEEPLSDFLCKHVMRRHVKDMQRSLTERVQAWQDRKKACMSEELQMMGLASKDLEDQIGRRPRAMELSRLQGLYVETFEKMKAGDFKHLFHDRRRILKMTWTTWQRKIAYGDMPALMARRASSVRRKNQTPGANAEPGRPSSSGSQGRKRPGHASPEPPVSVKEGQEYLSDGFGPDAGNEGLQPNSRRPSITASIASRDASASSRPSSGMSASIVASPPLDRGSSTGRPASARQPSQVGKDHGAKPGTNSRPISANGVPQRPTRQIGAHEVQVHHSIGKNKTVSKLFGL